MKKLIVGITFGLLILIAFGLLANQYYFRFGQDKLKPGEMVYLDKAASGSQSGSADSIDSLKPVDYTTEVFVENLSVPWSMVFTSPNRVLVTERPGRVRVITDGVLAADPIRVFSEVVSTAEEGLMGMTLDPDYETNKFIYLCIAYEKNSQTVDKVIRLTDFGDSLGADTLIIDDIPAAKFHAGCRLGFGPDNKLYISTGDATQKESAQETDSLAGKMLRLEKDGSIPDDNPFPGSAVYSLGHRNSQGFDWHPISGLLIATEHGPSGNDGPGGGDEVNLVEAGKNYGWPVVSHTESAPGMVDPLIEFTPAVAPASGMFYSGNVFPQFTNSFLFGVLRGQGIIQVSFDPTDTTKVTAYQKIPGVAVGRVRDVVQGPDGLIYFTTSNTDGRGSVRTGDDKILRLVPKNL